VQDKESVDPSRVGGPTNHLLSDGLSTSIGEGTKGASSIGLANTLKRTHARSGDADRSLLVAFGHIGKICDAMSLVRSIKDTACELYKQISESRSIIGRGAAPVAAAVIYIACRSDSWPS
jgi:transcription initiation factor TFIIB